TPMEVALDAGKQITIATDRVGDKIFVDGQLAGESPLNISLSFGKHKVFAMRGSDKTIEESIDIFQATTAKQFHLNFGPIELTVKGVKFEVIPVVGGTFKMGSIESNSNDNERPVHNVTLTDFYIGRTEVTQALWEAVMGNNPSKWKDDKLPVNQVSWNDCKEFIAKLNKLTGRTFRLPTEAEWEYAARGGCKSRGYNYSGDKKIGKVAWYENNSKSKNEKAAAVALQILAASTKQNIGEINVERKTHFVGEKQPNELGIYDMSGNVWEWCSDWYGPYNLVDQYNPTGIENGNHRVLRGGGLHSREKDCRVSCRIDCAPDIANEGFGLRLVLDI
ncbi:MAG: SUMF1/EgtB/PvdO family nonheme iron enzyme, partial [Bacteroidaceae bacterium]|nr:SUMF1/EgtB/PvdO family nonheme iron enzyme [Bacteroidaceae bacterium]